MKLIVGLGNPGNEYAGTRHNIGRSAIEAIAKEHSLRFEKKKSLKSQIVLTKWEDESVALAFPEVYMNESGKAVERLVQHFEIDFTRNFLAVIDDAALPFGKLRLRGKGSEGGHNGLKSIRDALQSTEYARLRIGIGPSESASDLAEYVLAAFDSEEKKALKQIFKKVQHASEVWASQSLAAAMNRVN